MDLKKDDTQKIVQVFERINDVIANKSKKQLLRIATKLTLALYLMYIVIPYFVYPAFLYYAVYKPFAADHIEAYLNKTSETILLKSSNNTEIADNIIQWERDEFISGSTIFDSVFDPLGYRIPKNAGWYIFLNKGNCGERALIFNDMARRTGLSYRKIVVDGFIDSDINFDGGHNSGDHSWSEFLLEDGTWVIADVGFDVSPLYKNKSVFCDEKNMLLGPVFVYDNLTTTVDCTEDYVNNTKKLKVKAVRDGKEIDNASIKIALNYDGKSKMVAGGLTRFVKFKTNESGISRITLGIYDNASYTLKVVDSKGVYQYESANEILFGNSTEEIEVEVDRLRPNAASLVFGIIVIPYLFFLRKMLTKKTVKKEKHEKL